MCPKCLIQGTSHCFKKDLRKGGDPTPLDLGSPPSPPTSSAQQCHSSPQPSSPPAYTRPLTRQGSSSALQSDCQKAAPSGGSKNSSGTFWKTPHVPSIGQRATGATWHCSSLLHQLLLVWQDTRRNFTRPLCAMRTPGSLFLPGLCARCLTLCPPVCQVWLPRSPYLAHLAQSSVYPHLPRLSLFLVIKQNLTCAQLLHTVPKAPDFRPSPQNLCDQSGCCPSPLVSVESSHIHPEAAPTMWLVVGLWPLPRLYPHVLGDSVMSFYFWYVRVIMVI